MTVAFHSSRAKELLDWFREYSKNFDVYEYQKHGAIPRQAVQACAQRGLFAMHLPEKFGGMGLSIGDTAKILQQIATVDLSLAAFVVSHHSATLSIASASNADCFQSKLLELSNGEKFAAFALSETGAGSNPRAMTTTASQTKDGYWSIDGEKYMIGGANVAQLFTLFAKSDQGISAFVVPANLKGVSVGNSYDMLGLRAYKQFPIQFNNVILHEESLLGKSADGMTLVEASLSFGRLAATAISLGVMKRCVQFMIRYSKQRKISTGLLINNPVTGVHLNKACAAIVAIEAMINMLNREQVAYPSELSIAAKLAATEHAWKTIDTTMQILGARGFQETNGVSRMFRDARFTRIGEGPTETLTMQLGAVLLSGDDELRRFLQTRLKTPKVLEELDEVVAEFDRYLDISDNVQQQWLWYVCGNLAVWEILRAALLTVQPGDEIASQVGLAMDWVRQGFSQDLRELQAQTQHISWFQLRNNILSYSETFNDDVGELDNGVGMPPENFDPYLCIDRFPVRKSVNSSLMESKIESEINPVQSMFENQARRTPDAIALRCKENTLSYYELDCAANRLAHYLLSLGLPRSSRVAICMGCNEHLIISVLAVLKAGFSFILLDSMHPKKRLASMCVHAQLLLSEQRVAECLPEFHSTILYDSITQSLNNYQNSAPQLKFTSLTQAYVAHTSGSTGTPKAVSISHYALQNQIKWRNRALNLNSNDCFLHLASPAFDIAVWELLGAISAGASLAVSGDVRHEWDAAETIDVIHRHQVTMLGLVPSQLSILIEQPVIHRCACVRVWISGGEMLYKPLRNRILNQFDAELLFLYGPTETTIDAAYWFCKAHHKEADTPLGYPIHGKRLYVLDPEGQILNYGEWGELYIGGVGVADGYLQQAEETARHFMLDPFVGDGVSKMYRSGDRVRWREDGSLQFGGRLDRQIKIRGNRIEAGEIEACLNGYDAVQLAVVDVRQVAEEDRRLVAWLKTLRPVSSQQLRDYLQSRLPSTFVPSAFVFMEEWPKSASGKIDYTALPDVDWGQAASELSKQQADSDREPATRGGIHDVSSSLVSQLISHYAKLLHVAEEKIGVSSDFFNLGGHSLLALQLLTWIRDQYNADIRISEFGKQPYVSYLAQRIQEKQSESDATNVKLESRHSDACISDAQQQLWFLQVKSPNSVAYNEPWCYRLRGELSIASLNFAFNTVVHRHESLRGVFIDRDGHVELQVQDYTPYNLRQMSLQEIPVQERLSKAQEIIEDETAQVFDLSAAVPFRAVLIRLDHDDHILHCVFHHIIADGWSIGRIFSHEISEAYRSHVNGEALSLPDLSMQPRDYVKFFTMDDAQRERDLIYWKKQLSGIAPDQSLPMDGDRHSCSGNQAVSLNISFSAQQAIELRRIASDKHVSVFVILLTALQILIRSYRQNDDVVIGTPLANRNHSNVENVIGNFTDMTVIRSKLGDIDSIDELIRSCHETILQALEHQSISFSELVTALQVQRIENVNPIFQIAFTYYNAEVTPLNLPGINSQELFVPHPESKFDFLLWLKEDEKSISGYMQFNKQLFSVSTMQNIRCHYHNAVRQICAVKNTRLIDICILNEEERLKQLRQDNPQKHYARELGLHRLFELHVDCSPQSLAVTFADKHVSYGDLNALANTIAWQMMRSGVQIEQVVGVCFDPSPLLIASILAILKCGATYLPLEPKSPSDRSNWILNDSGAHFLITHPQFSNVFDQWRGQVVYFDETLDIDMRMVNPQIEDCAERAAYIIYTSGSTGKPKGVVIPHKNVTALLTVCETLFELNEKTVWTLFHSVAFDFSVWELWGALTFGGRLVLVPYTTSRNPTEFRQLIISQSVSVLNQTPSAFYQLMDMDLQQQSDSLNCLKYVIFGGEALDFSRLRAWFDRYGDESPQLINMYGITETTVHASYRRIRSEDIARESLIGKALPHLQFFILGSRRELLPRGAIGELCVAGEGLAKMYLNHPKLTAERFIQHPFSNQNERLYRSGDLARFTHDGDIAYCGRVDHQIKLRGFRIELGEIESCLQSHPRIVNAVVKAMCDPQKRERLVAYIVVQGQNVSHKEMYQYLSKMLPEYMIPTCFMQLNMIELNQNGKLARDQLPEPDWYSGGRNDQRPQTELQQSLSNIWMRILNVDTLGIDQGFFELGGDSILSIRLLAEMKQENYHIPLEALLRLQTIRNISEYLEETQSIGDSGAKYRAYSLITEEQRSSLNSNIEDAYPASQLQAGMLYRQTINSAMYHDVLSVEVQALFDAAALQDTFNYVIKRHEILRTGFDLNNHGSILQLVHKEVNANISWEDISLLNCKEQEIALQQYCCQEQCHEFDFKSPPLVRVHAQTRGKGSFNLIISFSHAIMDGWSFASFRTELLICYRSRISLQRYPQQIAPQARYAQFIAEEIRACGNQQNRHYWCHQLQDYKPSALCFQPANNKEISIIQKKITREQAEALEQFAHQVSIPVKTVLLAAHMRVMASLFGSDVSTGLTVQNRPHDKDGDRIIGLFINSIPFRLKLCGGSWRHLIQQCYEAELILMRHQHVPLAEILRICGNRARFASLFVTVNFHIYQQLDQYSDISVRNEQDYQLTEFPLVTGFLQNANTSLVEIYRLDYDPNRVETELANFIADSHIAVLSQIIENPDSKYNDYPKPLQGALLESASEATQSRLTEHPSQFKPPVTELEKELHKIWAQFLGPLGVDESFLMYGDSIDLLRMAARVEVEIGQFDMRAFLKHATIQNLARLLGESRSVVTLGYANRLNDPVSKI